MPTNKVSVPDGASSGSRYRGHCTVCGWSGQGRIAKRDAVKDYVMHQRSAHPEGTTQIGVTRKDA